MPALKDSVSLIDPSRSHRQGSARVFLVYFLLPLLAGLIAIGSAWLLPAHVHPTQGQGLATQFAPGPFESPLKAAAALQSLPTRLSKNIPVGPHWLLAELDTPSQPDIPPTSVLLIPTATITPPVCWLFNGNHPGQLTPLTFQLGILGYSAGMPGTTAANRVLCEVQQFIPGALAIQQWSLPAFSAASGQHAYAMGMLTGGLLLLIAFIAIVSITTHDHLYVLLAAWMLCNVRLGAWALGWDHFWLEHTLSPPNLIASRNLVVLFAFTLTWLLFSRLFRHNLGARLCRHLQLLGLAGSALLLASVLLGSSQTLQTTTFLAAWADSALVATILVHALFRVTTRTLFWHTLAVCLAVLIIVIGLILLALGHINSIDSTVGVALFLGCNLLVALATANRTREDRQLRLRQRNELIVHDSLSPLGLFTLSATRHFEHLNPNARQMLAIDDSLQVPALKWRDYFEEIDWVEVSLATEQGRDTEIQLAHRSNGNSSIRSFLLRATLAGSRIEGSLQDVTARSETLRNLRLMTDHDALTNTLNRRGIESAIAAAIEDLQQNGTPCTMSYLSLDHLKRVNDLFGHSAGDQLLQLACDRLRYSLTDQQKVGRIGTDEFIILFPNMRARDARLLAQDMVDSLNSAPFYVGDRSFQVKSAMGLIDLNTDMDPKDALAAGTRACRDARKQHQDIVLYEENTEALFDHINELRVFEQLEQGTPPEDLYLLMQPIVSLRHPLKMLNFEVLLRVRQKNGHVPQTQKIIQAAEDSGMITAIDKWVVSSTLDWMIKNHDKLHHTQLVNLNLSGVSLNDDRFVDSLFSLLNLQPQLSRRLCIEITEGVALQDLERTRQFMRRLQRMGARVALDDFGAGYTSFSYLKELPADTIKIDGSLIRDMLGSEANIAIVNSIVDLAHNLGMECIAEWVEDEPTLRALAEMGVDYVQGYIVSPACEPAELLAHKNILTLISDPATRTLLEEISGRRS